VKKIISEDAEIITQIRFLFMAVGNLSEKTLDEFNIGETVEKLAEETFIE
jgi:hypothetical protein